MELGQNQNASLNQRTTNQALLLNQTQASSQSQPQNQGQTLPQGLPSDFPISNSLNQSQNFNTSQIRATNQLNSQKTPNTPSLLALDVATPPATSSPPQITSTEAKNWSLEISADDSISNQNQMNFSGML